MTKKISSIIGITILLIVIAIAAVLFLYFQPDEPVTVNNFSNTQLINEEYDIYSILINSQFVYDQIKLLVIEEDTTKNTDPGNGELNESYFKQNMPELQQETIDNFKKANQQSYPLKRQFELPISYVLLDRDEFNKFFEEGKGWDGFYEQYPGSQGMMTLSRVGFNNKMDQALIYVGNQGSWLAGTGYVYLLVKEDGVWKIKREVMVWIS